MAGLRVVASASIESLSLPYGYGIEPIHDISEVDPHPGTDYEE